MDAEDIARRLEEVRERIRRELADAEPPRIAAGLADAERPRLEEPPDPQLSGQPQLGSTPHLESANRLAVITAPVQVRSQAPVIGPLVDLLRRLARPFVQPFLDPYLDRQERFNAEVVRHLNELGSRLERRLEGLREDLRNWATDPAFLEARLDAALTDYDEVLRRRHTVLFDGLEEELWALRDIAGDLRERVDHGLHDIDVRLVERAQAVDRRFDEKDRARRAMEASLGEAMGEVLDQAAKSRATSLPEAELLETRTMMRQVLERLEAAAGDAGAGAGNGQGGTAAEPFDTPLWRQLRAWMGDEDYRAFQGQFRGDEEAIRERLVSHLEHFRDVNGPVADLGCGRGEFLDLLAGADIPAIGVEINDADVEECRSRGHEAVTADLFEWLEERPAGSLGGVFLAQVIEHLPPPDWARFVELAASRLSAGGRLVVETINPESLYALSRAYVLDPTHTRPVHPELLAFFAARAGLVDVGIRFQARVPQEARIEPIDEESFQDHQLTLEVVQELNRRVARLNRICCAPQEYALVARRPRPREGS